MSSQPKAPRGDLDARPWQIKIGKAAWLFDMNITTFKRNVRPHVRKAKHGNIEYYPTEELFKYWLSTLGPVDVDREQARQQFNALVKAAAASAHKAAIR